MDSMEKMPTEKMIEKNVTEKKIKQKTALNGMPVYDINEPWVQQYIEDFDTEPSFF